MSNNGKDFPHPIPPPQQQQGPPPVSATVGISPMPPNTRIPEGRGDHSDYAVLSLHPVGPGRLLILPDGTWCVHLPLPGFLKDIENKVRMSLDPLAVISENLSHAALDMNVTVLVPRASLSADLLRALRAQEQLALAQAANQAARDAESTEPEGAPRIDFSRFAADPEE